MKVRNWRDFVGFDQKLGSLKISSDEISVINVHEIWDGPLDGICRWREREYYFFSFTLGNEWPRKYLMAELNQEQAGELKREDETHALLKEGKISHEEYSKRYDDYPEVVIEKKQIVGWFDSVEMEMWEMGSATI